MLFTSIFSFSINRLYLVLIFNTIQLRCVLQKMEVLMSNNIRDPNTGPWIWLPNDRQSELNKPDYIDSHHLTIWLTNVKESFEWIFSYFSDQTVVQRNWQNAVSEWFWYLNVWFSKLHCSIILIVFFQGCGSFWSENSGPGDFN
jgi:hypothetical protein